MAASPAPAIASARVATPDNDIVVTGSRVRSQQPLRRGDWNACTIDDPKQDLSACRKQVDPAAPGVRGRAAAHLADGLALAWQAELTGAIAEFDRAIALAPRDAPARLNRALAYRRSGDLNLALLDLDEAVRLAPNTARYRYHRSISLRQKGDTRKAEADERRAIELDSRYETVIR
ncbi:hypothetical protein ASG11_12965 [Sphingomonas sp. Leaf357]|nr:hypothetical protein ASG11_12965 [Sphingomonas sp. Leaf357]